MYILEYEGKAPRAAGQCYLAENATLIGDVTLGEGVSIWPGAVLRADYGPITIGAGSNLQDGVIVHGDTGTPTVVGENCLIGHGAILHSCRLEPGVLVGMGATVMTGAVIGAGSVIGAGALVTEGKIIPPGSLVMGVPGRIVRPVTDAQREKTPHECREYLRVAQQLLRPTAPGKIEND